MEEHKKFYSVRRGRTTGIFSSWAECREQVHGYAGAVYKSFPTLEEAEQYLQHEDAQDVDDHLPFAYVDGSCSRARGVYGYGGILCIGGRYTAFHGSGSDPEYAQYLNVAGEVMGAAQAIRAAIRKGVEEINLYFDYAGIENWITGGWKARTKLARDYCSEMKSLSGKITVHYIHVNGHSGIKGNELADAIAKEAVGAKLQKKDVELLSRFRQGKLTVSNLRI